MSLNLFWGVTLRRHYRPNNQVFFYYGLMGQCIPRLFKEWTKHSNLRIDLKNSLFEQSMYLLQD